MDLGIADTVALVAGGSRGIGKAICEALGDAGCRIVILARDAAAIDALVGQLSARGVEATGVAADMPDPDSYGLAVRHAVERFGAPRIAIFNGLSPKSGSFDALTDADFVEAHHMLVGCFAHMVRAVAPGMRQAGWGRIVTVGSNVAKQPFRGERDAHYALANTERTAAVGLSKTLSAEMAPFGITVNTILTGAIRTESALAWCPAQAREAGLDEGAFLERFVDSRIPVGRMGTPGEMAALTAFLCSAHAGYTTGEAILCDGGVSMALI